MWQHQGFRRSCRAGYDCKNHCCGRIHAEGATLGHLRHLQNMSLQKQIGIHQSDQQDIRTCVSDRLRMLDLVDFLIGFCVLFGCLSLVGITRGKWVSQKMWVFLWSTVSLLFAIFICVSFVLETVFLSFALGGSLGFVIAVAAHTIQHAINEIRKSDAG